MNRVSSAEVLLASELLDRETKESLIQLRQYALSGVSFAIPFIACRGILVAAAIACNEHYSPNAPVVITGGALVLQPGLQRNLFYTG